MEIELQIPQVLEDPVTVTAEEELEREQTLEATLNAWDWHLRAEAHFIQTNQPELRLAALSRANWCKMFYHRVYYRWPGWP